MKGIKKAISLGVALVLVAGMVGLLLWQRNQEPEIEEPAEPAPSQITRIVDRTEDEIEKVVFQGQDDTVTMVPFTDEDGLTQWKMEGFDYILSNVETRNKIRGAFNLFSSQIIQEDISEAPELRLEDFGFNQMIVTAHYTDGTTKNIYMGSPTADFRGHFVMIEGDPGLYVISMLNAQRILLELEDMLEVVLPEWDAESIEYMLVAERGRDIIELSRRPHEVHEHLEWVVMDEPFPGREVFLSNLDYHIMSDFAAFTFWDIANIHPADLSPYGLDDPSLEFIYRAPHGEAHLLFGDVFFREIGDNEVAFIYVKFADRPHVFEALYEPARILFNMNPLRFVARFVALIDIQTVDRIDVTSPSGDFEIFINQVYDSHDIEPTVNGIEVEASPFRLAYRALIGIGIDAEIEPFTPTEPPLIVITYTLFDEDDLVLRLYNYDANFLAVAVNDDDIWFVTNRRGVDDFIWRIGGFVE